MSSIGGYDGQSWDVGLVSDSEYRFELFIQQFSFGSAIGVRTALVFNGCYANVVLTLWFDVFPKGFGITTVQAEL